MNTNVNLIESLTDSQIFQDYERAYSEATGLPITLRSVETWQLPLHGKRKENGFCALLAEKSRTCGACMQTQERLAQSAMQSPATLTCSYGLCETAVPVRLADKTIGFLQTGQVLRQKPTAAQFQRVAAQLKQNGVNGDGHKLKDAYLKTPVVSQKKLDSITHLLSIFAEHLALKSNQIVMQRANAEPPVITKAKQYIQEHFIEELSLDRLAAAVHTSTFYFCKLFKKATGINFTQYVARTRAEKAKNLLLNPNLRVSEIAYEVGFQSLTHFNRMFKRIVGQSPTQYRAQLPQV
ncbi:MAG: PocR ligand-binding domain-containing protein [Verrucomicrobia bacterium]|nr:PocR ligand-binding domain-containing protein [Verrucomicrobiota bacterium]